MARQHTEWGEIQWQEENRDNTGAGQQVGIVTVYPHGHQPPHIHFEEQTIYVLEGEAESSVGGVTSHIAAGDLFHWPAGIIHEIRNTRDLPFRHLLVASPAPGERDSALSPDTEPSGEIAPDLIYIAAEAVRTQFLETLPYSYALFDSLGNLIFQSQRFPEYCRRTCQAEACPGRAECMIQGTRMDISQEQIFHCRHGIEVYQYPVTFAGHTLGCLQAGYIRHSHKTAPLPGAPISTTGNPKGENASPEGVYDVPESVVTGVKALIRRIVKAIRNYCEFEQFRRELSKRETQISTAQEQQDILVKDLRDTRYSMTDLKINNHFLFNTLNSMASMALDGGQLPLYQSIVDLSKMFHYTLRTQASIVPLYKEIEYVEAYLKLQKLRWEDQLHTEIHVDPRVREQQVPFNFLQPIVENAFTHGFHEDTEKHLRMDIEAHNNLIIRVTNSGAGLAPQEYFALNQTIRSNTSHGLSMINHKLQSIYDDRYDIRMSRAEWKWGGTTFTVILPFDGEPEMGGKL